MDWHLGSTVGLNEGSGQTSEHRWSRCGFAYVSSAAYVWLQMLWARLRCRFSLQPLVREIDWRGDCSLLWLETSSTPQSGGEARPIAYTNRLSLFRNQHTWLPLLSAAPTPSLSRCCRPAQPD